MNQLTVPVLTMSSRDIAELTDKEHKHVLRDCLTMFEELGLDPMGYAQNWTHPQNGQTYIEYLLPKDLVETLITGYSIKLRYQVIQRLHELENLIKPKVMLPQDLPTALRALADTHEQLQKAQFEREIAIKTKAHISDKKTATAMATASNAVQENQRLKDRIGQSKRNATVLAVERLTGQEYTWQALNKWCKAHGVKPQKVHDDRYGKVNTYPSQAWMDVYSVNLSALFGGV
ncbi:transcriptional regulator [Acinetobacter bohemicus]|uniref:Phage regulatory protein Rha (Phage_pRha) n=1 Tax=Acinetobacter bohemicus TaxID=1435036 RepID=A0A1I6UHD9_9GAMM|nr:Rha family transcriptional regulator [Acinetobacter bohemicus]KAB0654302.1 transcriptional regulator [Acinetobacter bohemicus]SFT00850.1 Phage regulatory protein Rha (Phage_pRha) [Acinetobacter bohemicus]